MIEIQTYPLTLDAPADWAYRANAKNFTELISTYHLRKERRRALQRIFGEYFAAAERLFDPEEKMRIAGENPANLYYHGKPHAIYQATCDGISVAKGILSRRDKMSSHLSLEGSLAIVFGAMFHDSGYVTEIEGDCKNYAARTPVHVDAGMKTVNKVLDEIKLPKFIDVGLEKVKRLAVIGIHSTHFPFTHDRNQEMRQLMYELPAEEIKEAFIVGLGVRLADLGGQVARRDYMQALPGLRAEINATSSGLGNIVIGNDGELPDKCTGFIKSMVIPTAGKIANAFFGKNNSFQKAWEQHLLVGVPS